MAEPGQSFRAVWTAAFYNEIREFMRSSKLTISGPGWSAAGRNGTSIAFPRQKPGTGGGVSVMPPWFPTTTGTSGSYTASFAPGTVGGIVPSNMFSAIALTQNQKNYLYLSVTAAAGVITGSTITASTTYPTLAASNTGSPPSSFIIPVAIFDLTATKPAAYNIVGFGNIWVQPFISLWDTINTGALLTAPFTGHYNWEWGAGGS